MLVAGALGLAVLSLTTGMMRAIDASRLIGFGLAAAVLLRREALWALPSWRRRLVRILLSLVMVGLTVGWFLWSSALGGGDFFDRTAWLAVAVVLHAAVVLVPIAVVPARRKTMKR
jgi:hypothetical protein